MADVEYLSDYEIEQFIIDLDKSNNGYIDYWELEHKLDDIHKTIAPHPKSHQLHHPDNEDEARHQFLRTVIGTEEDRISRSDFGQVVRQWNVPSLEQDKKKAKSEDDFMKSLPIWRRFRSYWAIKGPSILFLVLLLSMQLAFGTWQLVKYLTVMKYRHAFGWGVVVAKTSAGILYPTLFFLILSMSRYLSTYLRRFYSISRFINWDLSQSFHIKISIVALGFATLHAIGHLTGSFLYGSRPAQQDDVALILGQDAVPRPYVDYVRSLPGWTGFTAFGLFWTLAITSMPAVREWNYNIFQLCHLLMYPIIGLLIAHGTAGLFQTPILAYWLAFPTLLVIIERSIRIAVGFRHISAKLEILDEDAVMISATIPRARPWPYKAGQYIFLQVPRISFFQWHPFTISTCLDNRMQVHIKTDGKWTSKLRGMVKEGGSESINVGIDGPYGAPAQRFYDFNQSMVFGAGIGVTPFSGILTDLQSREISPAESQRSDTQSLPEPGREKHRRVDFHWMVRDKNNLLWFSDLLNSISAAQASSLARDRTLDIRIQTYVTQKRKDISTHIFRWLLEQHRTPNNPRSPLTGLINPTHLGRPDIARIMSEHYASMKQLQSSQTGGSDGEVSAAKELRVGVFFCGPAIIGYQLADQCRLLTAKGRSDGSRIQYHFMMEVF